MTKEELIQELKNLREEYVNNSIYGGIFVSGAYSNIITDIDRILEKAEK